MTKIERQHLRLVEAILFASSEPITEKQLLARLPEDTDLKGLLQALQSYYEGRGVVDRGTAIDGAIFSAGAVQQ